MGVIKVFLWLCWSKKNIVDFWTDHCSHNYLRIEEAKETKLEK